MGLYLLPEHARRDFARPRGLIYSGDLHGVLSRYSMLLCVGDVVSRQCYHSGGGRNLLVLVVDGKTRRSVRVESGFDDLEKIRVSNPRGTLSGEAEEVLCRLARERGRWLVEVDGEEDMIALAAVECAPPEAAVVYGVPGVGATIIVSSPLTRADASSRKLALAPAVPRRL